MYRPVQLSARPPIDVSESLCRTVPWQTVNRSVPIIAQLAVRVSGRYNRFEASASNSPLRDDVDFNCEFRMAKQDVGQIGHSMYAPECHISKDLAH